MRGNRTLLVSFLILFASSLAAGCGKDVAPTTPSSTNASPHPGATITGSLSGSSVSSISTQSTSTMTVSVTGTSITSTIDGSGHFVLTGVPAGDIHLRFHGGNIDATATLTAVQATDSIMITVTITGSTATIDSDSRKGDDQGDHPSQAVGTISGLTGTAPALTFVVGGSTIHTNANTRVAESDDENDMSLADDDGNDNGNDGGNLGLSILQNGLSVTVNGQTQPDGSILASRIEVRTISVKGTVTGLTGSCPALHFTLGSTSVTTTSSTSFDGVTCSSLKNGTVVEVKGTGSTAALTALKIEKDEDDQL